VNIMPVWLRATLFVLLIPGTVAGWLPWVIADEPPIARHAWLVAIGVVFIGAGWSVLLWCARDFAVRGRGTLAPVDPPRALVTHGLYEYVRNPMYVGVLTAVLGNAALFGSRFILVYAIVIALAFHTTIMVYEEPKLARSFGSSYNEYRARVPRWIPRRPGR
jgi:protein-S-isoprenylcysteine O-methyltransferase Ste14